MAGTGGPARRLINCSRRLPDVTAAATVRWHARLMSVNIAAYPTEGPGATVTRDALLLSGDTEEG